MEIKNRQKFLAIITGVAAGLYVANAAVISPLTGYWKDRSKEIATLRTKISDGTRMVKRRNVTEGQWDRMRTNALPSNISEAEGQMLKSFDRWERTAGITRVSIKPQWKRNEDDYMTLECRADYTGDISRLRHFLYELEHDPMGLKVDSIEIATRDENGAQLSLGIQVSGLLLNPPADDSQQP